MEASSQEYQKTINQIKTMVKQGQLDKAQSRMENLCPDGTQDLDTLMLWGGIYMARQKYDNAVNIFQSLAQLYPNEAGHYNSLGMALFMAGYKDAAMQSIKQAVGLAPTSVIFQGNLGKLYMMSEQWEEAIECFEVMLRKGVGKKTNDILEMVNHCREQMNLPAVALEHYSNAVDHANQGSSYLEI